MYSRIITILFLLSFVIPSFAQDYSLISQHDSVVFYANNIGYLKAMRVDSIYTIDGGKVHYPFKTQRVQYTDYYTQADTLGGSWLGGEIVEIDNWTYLPNSTSDTLKIKRDAALAESWTFFEASGYNTYIATVISLDTLTIESVEDSIKTIRIASYNEAMEIDGTDSLNGLEFTLSKTHGLIKGFEFYLFPELGQDFYSSPDGNGICDFYLYSYTYDRWNYSKPGLTFDRVKIENKSAADYASFSPGDFTVTKFVTGAMLSGVEYRIFHDTIKTVTDFEDHVSYTANRLLQNKWANIDEEGNFTSGTEFTNSVVTKNYSKTSFFFSALPEERFSGQLFFYDEYDSTFCVRSPKMEVVGMYFFDEAGFYYGHSYSSRSDTYKKHFAQVDGSYTFQIFDGAEDFYFYTLAARSNGIACREDNDTTLSIANHTSHKLEFDIFPNPTKNQLNIKIAEHQNKVDVKIFDLAGREVFSVNNIHSEKQISLPILTAGLYIVEIRQKEKRGTKKLVIQ